MSAIGIDFGNETCYIAVARAGGIETITNDYSQRATPSYVAFGPTRRDIGTSAKNKFITNLKNTVTSFKRLVGKNFKDPTLNYELSYLPYAVHELPNGSVGVKVSYLGHDVLFTVPQVTAMLMTKLKQITEASVGVKMTDCVISVPVFFTDIDRRTMLDICKIAGLNVLRLLNEPAAVALAYGFYRQDLSEDKPKKVAFVDIGHSAIQTSVCEFYKGRLKILACTWDYCLGGRDIDNCMVRYFSEEFKNKYNLNVLSNNRAIVRLLQECEKLKTQLSANPHVLPLNIECFMDDLDVSSSLGREKLEEICADILNRIETVLRRLVLEANLHDGELSAVEIIGGTTRMPAVKNIIKKVFGMEPSTTLNLDEAVAKGCALQAAMLSPGVKAREFFITDIQPFTIKLVWNISKSESGDAEVFPRCHPVPFSKLYTFFRKEDFTLDAVYLVSRDKNVPDIPIGSFKIKNVSQLPSGESAKIIVKIRINIHGIFTVCSAVMVDKDFKENSTLDQRAEDLMDIQMKNCAIPLDSQITEEKRRDFFSLKKHKKSSPGVELQVEAKVPQLTESELKTFIESERLNIKFDEIHSESMYTEKSNEVIDLLLQKGLVHCQEDGSIQIQVPSPQGKEETVVLRKSDGTSLYLTRDLAAAIDRYKKYHFDYSYYVVDSSQSKHFNNLKSILKAMEFSWESNIHHIPFGRVLNFSTRKGTAVFLHDILNEAKERTLEKMHESPNTKVTENFEEVADILGISSLIINDFSNKRRKEIPFSWDKVLSMTEDSGTSLQYCHARLCSIKEKSGLEVNTNWDLTSLVEQEAVSLISHLAKFDEVLYHSYSSLEPCVLVHYLFALRSELGRAVKVLNVKGSPPNTAQARLLLFHCAELILKKSLQLLGIQPLSKM